MSCRLPFLLATWIAAVSTASAHDPGLSRSTLVVDHQDIQWTTVFHLQDLELVGIVESGAMSADLVQPWFHLESGGVVLTPHDLNIERLPEDDVEIRLTYRPDRMDGLRGTARVLPELPFGHRQFFACQTASGETLARFLLSASEPGFTLDEAADHGSGRGFVEFAVLGVEHILVGYDHLLFLLAVLLVCTSFLSVLRVITAFTAAHSLTLGLCALGWMSVPAWIVEPAIAASIVLIATLHLSGRLQREPWKITFALGLLHGLGFAGVLAELLPPGNASVLGPLLAFNLGVEAGQVFLAALALPVLLGLRRVPVFAVRGVALCQGLIALMGLWWFASRTLPV